MENARPEVARDRQTTRRHRVPISGDIKKLDVFNQIDGYRLYWANDVDSRIPQMQMAGYEFVMESEVGLQEGQVFQNEALDTKVRRVVGVKNDNTPLYAYLMKIPMEFFEEDEKNREANVAKKEATMFRDVKGNVPESDPVDVGQFYRPRGSTSIKTETF